MKYLVMALMATGLCGCEFNQAEQLPVAKVQGWVYAMTGVATMDNVDSPDTPGPQPGDKCPNCNGTGKVGDGVVFTDCQECGGDGVLDADEVALDAPGSPGVPGITATSTSPAVGSVQQTQVITRGSTTICGPSGCYTVPGPADRSKVYTPQRPRMLRRLFR